MERSSNVYILTDRTYGTLYIGVTANLVKRVWQHRTAEIESFTRKYHLHRLVWYEVHSDIVEAITREKQLKKWNRAWKISLIERANPEWRDLHDEIAV